MGVNSEANDDGKYITHSSLSVVASRATLKAQDIVATSTLSAAALTLSGALTASLSTQSFTAIQVNAGAAINPSIAFTSEKSLGLYRSGASTIAMSFGELLVNDGVATRPGIGFSSEASLGFIRSASSVIAPSYGYLKADFISSSTTNASQTTALLTNQGGLVFSVLSATVNGAEIQFRSGNTVYHFYSGTSNQQV